MTRVPHAVTIASRRLPANRWPSTHRWCCGSCGLRGRWTRYPSSAMRRGARHVAAEQRRVVEGEILRSLLELERAGLVERAGVDPRRGQLWRATARGRGGRKRGGAR